MRPAGSEHPAGCRAVRGAFPSPRLGERAPGARRQEGLEPPQDNGEPGRRELEALPERYKGGDAAAVGAHFFDLHRWFSAAAGCLPRTPACATHFMPDGIHTNEKGTALIAKLARRALAETCIVPGGCIPDDPHVVGYHRCKPCVPTA